MTAFGDWWGALTAVNQWFFIAGTFFGVVFLAQLIMTLAGLSADHGDLDTHPDDGVEHHAGEASHETVIAFKLLSTRSVIAFFTLFSWAGALYLNQQVPLVRTLVYAVVWGAAAMILVALVFHTMRKLTQTGSINIAACVGADGTVYLDIPAGGEGEIRVLCGGVMTHFKARVEGGAALKAGTPVKVAAVLNANTVRVETI